MTQGDIKPNQVQVISSKVYCQSLAAVGLVTVAFLVQVGLAQAQPGTRQAEASPIASTIKLTVQRAQARTMRDIQQAGALAAPRPVAIPFRPTIDPDAYKRAKDLAAVIAVGKRPPRRSLPTPLTPIVTGPDFDGVDQTGAMDGFPPDTDGAVGANEYVQITNSHVDIYDLTGNFINGFRLADLFGYFNQAIFDPRVMYDLYWNRWVISAEAFPEGPNGPQYEFLAFSFSSDANAGYWLYGLNIHFDANAFWDFPQLGMDQDSVLITANYFIGNSFNGARAFALAKAVVYNGFGFSVPLFTGLCGTLAPPNVLDNNSNTFLVCAPPGGSTVTMYTWTNTARNNQTLVSTNITVSSYSVPPCAQQPGGAPCLDTSDSRFVNRSTQNGNSLWNIHSINFFGPALEYYEFNTATKAVIQDSIFYTSGTSADWNGSIAANFTNDALVTYSSTDAGNNILPQMWSAGRCHGDPVNGITLGNAVRTSPTFSSQFDSMSNLFRWGDYSAVALQYTNPNNAWIVNEWAETPGTWASHITQIGFGPPCP